MKEKPLLQKHPIVILPTNEASKLVQSIKQSPHYGVDILKYTEGTSLGNDFWQPQHLYVLSNEEWGYEGNSGDWVCLKINEIAQLRDNGSHIQVRILGEKKYEDCNIRWKKIIATTDSALWMYNAAKRGNEGSHSVLSNCYNMQSTGVAKLPTDFITAFIKNYNAGTPIAEILVEYKSRLCARDEQGTCIESIHCGHRLGSAMPVMVGEDCNARFDGLNLRPDGSIIIHPVKERMFMEAEMIAAFKAGRSWTYDLALGRSSGSNTYYSFEEWFKQHYPD